MTDKKSPEKVDDQDLDQAQGGTDGMRPPMFMKVDLSKDSATSSFDLSVKEAEIKDFDGVRATGVRIEHTKLRK